MTVVQALRCNVPCIGNSDFIRARDRKASNQFREPTMAQKINDAWQQAVRGMDIAQMEALLSEDPGLASQGIVHTRGNGTTYRKSPLRMVNRSIDAAQLLLNAGADPNDGADSVLAIHNASPEVAELLLNAGAEIDRIGYEQGTALMFEVGQRNPDTAKLFIERGADLNIQRTICLLYTSPSPRDQRGSRMPSSA